MNTGEVYNIYKELCKKTHYNCLTQRRTADLISELDMLGIITARVISKGRYGRTREIQTLSTDIIQILSEDETLKEISQYKLKNQIQLKI